MGLNRCQIKKFRAKVINVFKLASRKDCVCQVVHHKPGHHPAILAGPLHGVSLPTPSHPVGEEQPVLPLDQVCHKGQANPVEHVSLGRVLVKHV